MNLLMPHFDPSHFNTMNRKDNINITAGSTQRQDFAEEQDGNSASSSTRETTDSSVKLPSFNKLFADTLPVSPVNQAAQLHQSSTMSRTPSDQESQVQYHQSQIIAPQPQPLTHIEQPVPTNAHMYQTQVPQMPLNNMYTPQYLPPGVAYIPQYQPPPPPPPQAQIPIVPMLASPVSVNQIYLQNNTPHTHSPYLQQPSMGHPLNMVNSANYMPLQRASSAPGYRPNSPPVFAPNMPSPYNQRRLSIHETGYDSGSIPSNNVFVQNRFQCDKCPKSYTRKHNLVSHTLSVHEKEKLFKCDTCLIKFSRASDLSRHTKEQHSKVSKPFICGGLMQDGSYWGCGKRFYRKDQLKSHLNTNKAGVRCKIHRASDSVAEVLKNFNVGSSQLERGAS